MKSEDKANMDTKKVKSKIKKDVKKTNKKVAKKASSDMKKIRKARRYVRKKRKGFTLVELLGVILILGIFSLIAVPTVNNVVTEAKRSSAEQSGNEIVSATEKYYSLCNLNYGYDKNGNACPNDLASLDLPSDQMAELISVSGTFPDYEDIIVYNKNEKGQVSLVFRSDNFACSNLVDSEGNVSYKDTGVIGSGGVKCEDKIITNTGTVLLKTDGTKHTLESTVNEEQNSDKVDVFKIDEYKDVIYEIKFVNHVTIPSTAGDKHWAITDDESIIAWLVPIDAKYYTLYIGSLGDIYASSISTSLFRDMPVLTKISFGNFKTNDVTDMSYMFYNDNSLTELDLSGFDTSNVTNMSYMFYGSLNLESVDLRSFDTSKVENFNYMFSGVQYDKTMNLKEIKGIENFNMTSAKSIEGMFANSTYTSLDLSKWNTSSITNMSYAFMNNYVLTDLNLSGWNTSMVENFSNLFFGDRAIENLDVSHFNTISATKMNGMFANCWSLKSLDLTNWNTSNLKEMRALFYNTKSIKSLDISSLDTSNVIYMTQVFMGMRSLTELDVTTLNTSNVKEMFLLFADLPNVRTLDLTNFDTSNVTDMYGMFLGNIIFENDVWSNFNHFTSIYGLENLNTSKVKDMYGMFRGNSGFVNLNLSNWDVSSVEDMSYMFAATKNLAYLDISNWNTKSLKYLTWTFGSFYGSDKGALVSQFKEIKGLKDLNTSEVTDMSYTFYRCGSFKVLDISGWDTSRVITMNSMFRTFPNLTTIYVSDRWSIASLKDDSTMFAYTYKLKGAVTYTDSKKTKAMANWDTGYLTYKEYTK